MPQLSTEDRPNTTEPAKTVLFVDDEPGLLEVYEVQHGSKYDVLTAVSGKEALDLFGEHIDFAFFDRRMPGMSGGEAIEALRDQGYQTPIGIISAVDSDANLSVTPDVYLTKPVTKEQVQAVIDQYTTE